MQLSSMILSAIPYKIQCSNDKRQGYKLNVNKYYAIDNYKFIQITHPQYYTMLSIDIDDRCNLPTFEAIYIACEENKIPYPTLIVETDKGWHIHWYLNTPIWKNNRKQMVWRSEILDYINDKLGGDKNFAGFIGRNPLQHNHIYHNIQYIFDDFKHICDIKRIIITKNNRKFEVKNYDFSSVSVGYRNETLYNYLRDFCFKNFKNIDIDDVIKEALNVNSKFITPLYDDEVVPVAKSVYNFVARVYNNKINKENINKKNRQLAKNKKKNKYKEFVNSIINNYKNANFYKLFYKRYSINKLSKLFGVSRYLINKYFDKILKIIIKLIKQNRISKEITQKIGNYMRFNTFKSYEYNFIVSFSPT